MCGRYTLTVPVETLANEFDLTGPVPEVPPSYNIAPTQEVAVVLEDGGEHRLEMLRWGLIPSWADDPQIGSRMINARSETAAEKPSFRRAFRERRCLIPADGFYEWQGTNNGKQPFYIHMQDGSPSPGCGRAGTALKIPKSGPARYSPQKPTNCSLRYTTAYR